MADAAVEWRTPTWTLGDRMRKARLDAGLEQSTMAELLGVKQVAVSKWERDLGQPRHLLEVLRKWSDATHVSLGWLLGVESTSGYKPHLALVGSGPADLS